MTNKDEQDQTAPMITVWSRCTLFATETLQMDLHRLNDSITEMHLKFTSAGVISYMLMLTPSANFAMDTDQTVPRRVVRFWSKLLATKTSYGQTNIVKPVQAAPWIVVWYGSTLFATKTAYGSWCQGNATYNVNGQYPRTDKHLGPGSDCSYEIWVNIYCFKDVFQ